MSRQRATLTEPCPKCGPCGPLVQHLRLQHGFPMRRAKGIAARILNRERLSAGDCQQLGIPSQAVKVKGAMNPSRVERNEIEGCPTDEQLDATIRAAFPR